MRGKVLSLPMPDLRFPKPCRGPLSTFIVWSLHVRGTPVGVTEKSHRRRSSAQSPGRNCAAESTQADSSRRHLVLLLVRNCLQVPWLREPEMSVVTCNFHDWTVDAVVAEDQPRRVDRKTIRRCQVDARSFGQSCALGLSGSSLKQSSRALPVHPVVHGGRQPYFRLPVCRPVKHDGTSTGFLPGRQQPHSRRSRVAMGPTGSPGLRLC